MDEKAGMTRKDFEAIAKVFRESRPPVESITRHEQWQTDVRAMASMLAKQNRRFQRDRFLDACGEIR